MIYDINHLVKKNVHLKPFVMVVADMKELLIIHKLGVLIYVHILVKFMREFIMKQ